MAKKEEKTGRDYRSEVKAMMAGEKREAYERCLEEADDKLRPYMESVQASQQLSSADFSIYINTLD